MRASDVALDEGLELARRLHLDDPVDFPAALERDHRRDVLHGVLRDDLRILLGVAGGEDGAFGVDSRELREEGLGAAAVGARITGLSAAITDSTLASLTITMSFMRISPSRGRELSGRRVRLPPGCRRLIC